MKILFVGQKNNTNDYLNDYMSDLLLHGLREIFDLEVVDYPGSWYLYEDESKKRKLDKNKLWGKGFSVSNILNNYEKIDRTDIISKVKKKYFDLIIYGSIRRNNAFLDIALEFNNKIIFVDGEDDNYIENGLLSKGLYFKRELNIFKSNVHPISFAIPKFKIKKDISQKKSFLLSPLIPGKLKTYIYEDEQNYNIMYQNSIFALTYKKAGWDCFRHYEILMNGCIPFFLDLENCPKLTINNFPKKKILDINRKYETILSYYNPFQIFKKKFLNIKRINKFFTYKFKKLDPQKYFEENDELLNCKIDLLDYTKKNLTTENLGNYLIDKFNKS
tara:strand:- start:45 stop:1037 length:993 start_codon:yes stop_codon:yes gene_type:complete